MVSRYHVRIEFRETARLSSVAWIRQVLQVVVTPAPDPAELAPEGRSSAAPGTA
jgi:hypothetical protein